MAMRPPKAPRESPAAHSKGGTHPPQNWHLQDFTALRNKQIDCTHGFFHSTPSVSGIRCLCTAELWTSNESVYKQSGIESVLTQVSTKLAYAFFAFMAFIAFMAFFGAAAAAFAAFLAILLKR